MLLLLKRSSCRRVIKRPTVSRVYCVQKIRIDFKRRRRLPTTVFSYFFIIIFMINHYYYCYFERAFDVSLGAAHHQQRDHANAVEDPFQEYGELD